jgi:hypothetical protein
MVVGKRFCAALVAASMIVAEARPALAQEPTGRRYDGLGALSGALALTVTFLPMAVIALMSTEVSDKHIRAIEITLYTSSSLGVALGAGAITFEAVSSGTCGKTCRFANVSGGLGLGLGALGFVFAGFATYQRTHPGWPRRGRRAWVMPTPIAIPSIDGVAIGAGVTGVAF